MRPLAIVLEDMQWADRASWDALEFVVAQLEGARILICATIRAEEARDVAERRKRLARSPGVRAGEPASANARRAQTLARDRLSPG